MAESAAAISAAGSLRGRSTIVVCVLIGLAVFTAFLIANFPYSDTLTSMLAPYRLRLTYQSQNLSPPIGARLTGVRLFSTVDDNQEALLQSPAVTLSPTLAALLLGRRAMHLRAELYGGTVYATIDQHAGNIDLNFKLDALKLGESAPLRQLGLILNGDLSGAGTAQIPGPQFQDDRAAMAITGDNLTFSIVRGFPPIHLGTLTGSLQLDRGAIKLTDIVAHGADLDLKGAGTIELGASPDESTIDATFYLNPTQRGRDRFGFFLKLLPHPPGPDAPYSLQGYLQSPSIN